MLLSNRFNTHKLATSCGADALSQLDQGHLAPRTLQIIQSLLTDADTPAHMQHTQEQTGMLRRRQAVDALRVRATSFRDLGPSTIFQRAHASNCSSTVRTQHGHRREQVSPESTFTGRGCGSDHEGRARRHGNNMVPVTVQSGEGQEQVLFPKHFSIGRTPQSVQTRFLMALR